MLDQVEYVEKRVCRRDSDLLWPKTHYLGYTLVVKATNAIMPGDETLRHSSTVLRFRNATWMASEQPGDATLLSTIAESYKSLAKDRRDKIYALLASTSDARSFVPLSDYERPLTTLTTSTILSASQTDTMSAVPDWGNKLP